jgi:hypothetical protein
MRQHIFPPQTSHVFIVWIFAAGNRVPFGKCRDTFTRWVTVITSQSNAAATGEFAGVLAMTDLKISVTVLASYVATEAARLG